MRLKVELTILYAGDEVDPLLSIKRERLTGTVFGIPYNSASIRQGRHLHTSPLTAPAARPVHKRGVERNDHRDSLPLLFVIKSRPW